MQKSVDRTTRWLKRCKAEMARLNSLPDTINKEQLLFGINEGAIYSDIRINHAKEIAALDLDGYAIGGLAVGWRLMRKCIISLMRLCRIFRRINRLTLWV